MKKSIFFLAIFTLVAQTAAAANVRLSHKTEPLSFRPMSGKLIKTLNVYKDGVVTYSQCHKFNRIACRPEFVDQLSKREMRQVERKIRRAKLGTIKHPDPFAMRCLAVPFQRTTLSADNGRVLLSTGTYPCGGASVNTSDAAQDLMELLSELQACAVNS